MKKRNIIVVSAAFLAACLAAGWFALNGQAVSESAGHKTVYSTAEESVSISESVPQEVSVIRAYEEPWPIEKLMEKSTLVIRGTVESADVLEISGVRGGTLTMTEYQVKVSEVLRGEEKASVSVLRIGDPADEQVFFEAEPVLEQGKEYLLFLQSRDLGGDFNFLGDHYRVLGDRQGVYESSAAVPAREGEAAFSNQKELAAVGITIGEDGMLSVDREKLQASSIEDIQNAIAKAASKTSFVADRVASNSNANIESATSQYDQKGNIMSQIANKYDFWG